MKFLLSIIVYLSIFLCNKSIAETFSEQNSDSDEPEAIKEYCLQETFQPRCLKNEVIVMKIARFGRMRIGRCIEMDPVLASIMQDPRIFGCSANVLKLLDSKCSGKTQCEVRAVDKDLLETKPCAPNLNMYLEASYSCASVIDSDSSCSISATTAYLHLPSSLVPTSGCGSKAQPWMIEAQTGQQIEIDLLDFSDKEEDYRKQDGCPNYGYILERSSKANISICGRNNEMEKESAIYRSKGNALAIVLTVERKNYLIKFKAVGCSYLVPPQDTWLKRNGDEMTIGCYSSLQTWQLRCHDHQWIGVLGNCSITAQSFSQADTTEELPDTRQILALVTIVGLAVIACLLVICVGSLCLLRYGKKSSSSDKYNSYNRYGECGVGGNQKPYVANGSLLPYQHPTSVDSKEIIPSYSVYVGTNGRRQDGYYDGNISSNNENGAAQYFVLDREVVEKENGILVNC